MTTVEKIARAMHDAVSETGKPWRYVKGDGYCDAQMKAALAALKAMREPWNGMIDAMTRVHGGSLVRDRNYDEDCYDAWVSAIDAAIAEHVSIHAREGDKP